MGEGSWMQPGLSPEHELSLSLARREIPGLQREALEAHLDRALVDLAQTRQTLSDACRRIAELELREALGPQGDAHRGQWAAALIRHQRATRRLGGLFGLWRRVGS